MQIITLMLMRTVGIIVFACIIYGVITDIVAFDHESQIVRSVMNGIPVRLNRDYVRCFKVNPESIPDKIRHFIMGEGHVISTDPTDDFNPPKWNK